MHCTVILVAAGSSRRMSFDKLAADLNGLPVLARTLDVFLACEEIQDIILVTPEERMALLDSSKFTKSVTRVDGGAERQFSVAAGIAALPVTTDFVAVHDAARPLVSESDIRSVIAAAHEFGAASLARRVTETLKRTDQFDYTQEPVPRERLWFIETPQIFRVDWLREAYAYVLENQLTITDETSALEMIGKKTKLIASSAPNPKITTPADLAALVDKV